MNIRWYNLKGKKGNDIYGKIESLFYKRYF